MDTFSNYEKPLSKFQQAKKEAEDREYVTRKAEYDLMMSNKKKLETLELQKREAEIIWEERFKLFRMLLTRSKKVFARFHGTNAMML